MENLELSCKILDKRDEDQRIGEVSKERQLIKEVSNEHPISEEVNEEVNQSPTQTETGPLDDITQPPVDIPHQSSTEDVPEPNRKQLPHRHTRGIPKSSYEPELSSKVKYPMSQYVSNHSLSKSNMSFVNQLSSVSIPNSVQEAFN